VYAFGGVMYFLLTAQAPWSQELKQAEAEEQKKEPPSTSATSASAKASDVQRKPSAAVIARWVGAGRRPALSAELEREHWQYVQLMRWCWQQLPGARPSMSQVQSELQSLHALLTTPSLQSSKTGEGLRPLGGGGVMAAAAVSGSDARSAGSFTAGLGDGFVAVGDGCSAGGTEPASSALRPLATSGTLGLSPAAVPPAFPTPTHIDPDQPSKPGSVSAVSRSATFAGVAAGAFPDPNSASAVGVHVSPAAMPALASAGTVVCEPAPPPASASASAPATTPPPLSPPPSLSHVSGAQPSAPSAPLSASAAADSKSGAERSAYLTSVADGSYPDPTRAGTAVGVTSTALPSFGGGSASLTAAALTFANSTSSDVKHLTFVVFLMSFLICLLARLIAMYFF
jgi:hypothetical protein